MTTDERHQGLIQLYKSGKFTTERIAEIYHISPRQVQRVCKKYGVIRPLAESNKLMAKYKNYYHKPLSLRTVRGSFSARLRYEVIRDHPYCALCGATAKDGVRLEVDHKDNNPSNNELSNLQVLCNVCNQGKQKIIDRLKFLPKV